jgi:hypothetical protein
MNQLGNAICNVTSLGGKFQVVFTAGPQGKRTSDVHDPLLLPPVSRLGTTAYLIGPRGYDHRVPGVSPCQFSQVRVSGSSLT